ncbi:hypothetical protein M407DRAFT_17456 [Tulasnella calospora MUT 4182]|uniref:Uncharacterized protein n=1 Tax=Tulasnella calospora MUT 4182 TaxID=1051891 RepID=A0A0C3QLZ5_9AGAM|nr:hypothetical protein M407DRAFT_17456 [Tulasnella calospora MUT 4182]
MATPSHRWSRRSLGLSTTRHHPAGMSDSIKSLGTSNALRDIPIPDTVNLLAQNLLPDSGLSITWTSLISTAAAAATTKTAENATTTILSTDLPPLLLTCATVPRDVYRQASFFEGFLL